MASSLPDPLTLSLGPLVSFVFSSMVRDSWKILEIKQSSCLVSGLIGSVCQLAGASSDVPYKLHCPDKVSATQLESRIRIEGRLVREGLFDMLHVYAGSGSNDRKSSGGGGGGGSGSSISNRGSGNSSWSRRPTMTSSSRTSSTMSTYFCTGTKSPSLSMASWKAITYSLPLSGSLDMQIAQRS